MSKQPISLEIVNVGPDWIEVRRTGNEDTITLTYSYFNEGKGICVEIPFRAIEVLSMNGRYEMLKARLQQSHFKGIRIETRTESSPELQRIARNRAAETEPVSMRA